VGLAARQSRQAWLLLVPLLAALLLVALWPLARTIWLGFTAADLSSTLTAQWVGWENYLVVSDGSREGVLADPLWWRSVWNTLVFTVSSVTLETLLGLAIALILHRRFPGRPLVRAAVLIPWAIPTVVSAQLWGWILHDQFGLLNDLLLRLDAITSPLAWTADPDLSMISIIATDVWKTTPFMTLLLLAALQMVPRDYYEAARLDGVHPMAVFRRITLPLIRPVLLVAVLFRALDALRVFDLIYVLTPNSEETMSMSVYARQQLVDFQDVGYGSAASTLLFLTVGLLTLLYMASTRVGSRGLSAS
jgi:trehalose/maltose transport system permease protein